MSKRNIKSSDTTTADSDTGSELVMNPMTQGSNRSSTSSNGNETAGPANRRLSNQLRNMSVSPRARNMSIEGESLVTGSHSLNNPIITHLLTRSHK
jgi:hypothetical protein